MDFFTQLIGPLLTFVGLVGIVVGMVMIFRGRAA